ncbi:MAG TPA: type II toxin-antitoxin system prevent-host-death family antitoxin [Vicinamibacterales bacterium]|nr:type II toxin-antitoxin system prevent-host-death family antitoxin [Vicinamibacterales bacterium]
MSVARDRVGVRELRQNLSVYLARVARGETLEVTDRGYAVAVLAPLPPETTASARLIASGRAIAPARRLDELRALPSGLRADLGRRAQQALADDRRNDR